MNNWRLLLLALVAVFRPIASFTDRSLVDGRQQCCDRQSSTPLHDTRSSLYGTYRFAKTSYEQRRLNDRDEILYDRRYRTLREHDSIFSRPLTERPLLDSRERASRKAPFVSFAAQDEYRLQRILNDRSRDRLLDVYDEKINTRNIRGLKPEDHSRRVSGRTSNNAVERRNDRSNIEYSRNRLSRDDIRSSLFSNERLSNSLFNSQREMQSEEFRSGELGLTLKRDARVDFRRTKNNVARTEGSDFLNNRQHITRERVSVVRRESPVRVDERYKIDNNNEHRNQEHRSKQKGLLSENTRIVERIHDGRIHLNSREENRISINRQITVDGQRHQRGDHREQNKENIDRYLSRETIQISRTISRDSRNSNTHNEGDVDGRRETRYNKRLFKEIRDEINETPNHRHSRDITKMAQRIPRESRMTKAHDERDADNRRDIRNNERMFMETRDEIKEISNNRLSRERIQLVRRNIREYGIRHTLNERDENDQHEIKYNERISRGIRNERLNPIYRLSRERIQMIQKITHGSSIIYGLDSRQEIRNNVAMSREILHEKEIAENRFSRERIQVNRRNIRKVMKNVITRNNMRISRETPGEIRDNSEHEFSRTNIQTDRTNIRGYRIINEMVNRNDRHVASRREIRNNARMSRETRDEIRENHARRLSREKTQSNQRNVPDSRVMKDLWRNVESQREMRTIEKVSTDIRSKVGQNSDQQIARERRQVDKRNIHESRIINSATTQSERLSVQNRDGLFKIERGVKSRAPGKIIAVEKDNLKADRGARSEDRRNFSEIRSNRSAYLKRESDAFRSRVDHGKNVDNRERESNDVRNRDIYSTRNRESSSSLMIRQMEAENDAIVGNWQYVLHTLQAAYLGALVMHVLTTSRTKKTNIMGLRWLSLSSQYNPIKVD